MELIPGSNVLTLALSTFTFPLLTAVVLLLFGRRLDGMTFFGMKAKEWTGWLAALSLARSFISAVALFFNLVERPAEEREMVVRAFDWIEVGGFAAAFDLRIDPLSVVMLLVVTGVGTLI